MSLAQRGSRPCAQRRIAGAYLTNSASAASRFPSAARRTSVWVVSVGSSVGGRRSRHSNKRPVCRGFVCRVRFCWRRHLSQRGCDRRPFPSTARSNVADCKQRRQTNGVTRPRRRSRVRHARLDRDDDGATKACDEANTGAIAGDRDAPGGTSPRTERKAAEVATDTGDSDISMPRG
jgi:hypothetical protein